SGRDLPWKCSSPAPRSAATARRSATTRKAAATGKTSTTRKSPATSRSPGGRENIEKCVEEYPPKSTRNDEHHNESHERREDQPVRRVGALLVVKSQRRPLLPFGGVGGQNRDDIVDTPGDAAAKIAGFESRSDCVDDDDLRQRVGKGLFKSVTDLDADSPLVRRDEQKNAIVLCLFAEAPAAE